MSKLKLGEKVQVWDDKRACCLGWGKVVAIGTSDSGERVPLIKVRGIDRVLKATEYNVIPAEKAIRIAKRITRDLERLDK